MRESLAHALSASLEWDDADHERAIDKLTAFSMGDRLGTLLWRVKYKNCKQSYKPAVLLLSKRLDKHMNQGVRVKIATQAMHEWLFPFCDVCHGAKDVKVGALVVICKHCGGSGVKRYSDKERYRAVGIVADRHLNSLQSIIGECDRQVSILMRNKLGRDVG